MELKQPKKRSVGRPKKSESEKGAHFWVPAALVDQVAALIELEKRKREKEKEK